MLFAVSVTARNSGALNRTSKRHTDTLKTPREVRDDEKGGWSAAAQTNALFGHKAKQRSAELVLSPTLTLVFFSVFPPTLGRMCIFS